MIAKLWRRSIGSSRPGVGTVRGPKTFVHRPQWYQRPTETKGRRFPWALVLAIMLGTTPSIAKERNQPFVLTGTLSVVHQTLEDGGHDDAHYLSAAGAGSRRVVFTEEAGFSLSELAALDGRDITVAGTVGRDGTIYATSAQASTSYDAPNPRWGAVVGSKKIITLLCSFTDTTPQHAPSWYVKLMGSLPPGMDNFWREQSYGALNLTQSHVDDGWRELPFKMTDYTYPAGHPTGQDGTFNGQSIFNDCTAAADPYVNFAGYDYVDIMLDGHLKGWQHGEGGANGHRKVLDGVDRMWPTAIQSSLGSTPRVVAQEIGHFFALPHSSSQYQAANSPYDSKWDVMSGGGTSSGVTALGEEPSGTIAWHKDRLGWIPPSRKYVPSWGSTQTIWLRPLSPDILHVGEPPDHYMMAEVPILLPGGSPGPEIYTIEARRNNSDIGHDRALPHAGVIIHRVTPCPIDKQTPQNCPDREAQVVDGDNDGDPNDHGAVWSAGETFTDAEAGIRVSVGAHNGQHGGWPVTISHGPGLAIDRFSVRVREGFGGAIDSYWLGLTVEPISPVTVTPVTQPDQFWASPSSITFTPENWWQERQIDVTAVDDSIPEPSPVAYLLGHDVVTTDPLFAGAVGTLGVQVDDNDGGIVLSKTTAAVSESGLIDTYTIRLAGPPSRNVTLTPQLNGSTEVTVSPSSLTFTTGNYATAQTITVRAVDDSTIEPNPETILIRHIAASMDTFYDRLSGPTLAVSVTDNDGTRLIIGHTGTGTQVTEGGATDTYTVRLGSEPAANVSVMPSSSGAQVTVLSAVPLTFTKTDWNIDKAITLAALDDAVQEISPMSVTVLNTASSSDPLYNGKTAAITASVFDNDVARLIVTHSGSGTQVTEGGATDTYTVRLGSEPAADVSVMPSSSGAQVTVPSAVPLTFTKTDWNIDKAITLAAIDDAVQEISPMSVTVLNTASSSDPFYNGKTAAITASVFDNDVAGVTLSHIGGATVVSESGTTDQFTVKLNTKPAAPVRFDLSYDVVQIAPTPSSFTIDASNWANPMVVNVVAVDDWIAEVASATVPIGFHLTSSDPFYHRKNIGALSVTVLDNDTTGVDLVESAGFSSVHEGNATSFDDYRVSLRSQPTHNVVVTVSSPDGQLVGSPSTLTFTPANWNAPQWVEIRAVDDSIEEEAIHVGLLRNTVTSADGNYHTFFIPDVASFIVDNDDTTAPTSQFETPTNSILIRGSVVRGLTHDNRSGITSVELTYEYPVGFERIGTVPMTLTCADSGRTLCRWSWTIPDRALPGPYTLRAKGRDFAGNNEVPGPSISVIVI